MRFGYWLIHGSFRLIFSAAFRMRVNHAERLPAQGPAILASNHASFLDPPIVGCASRREISYLARDTLFLHPIVGPCLRYVPSIPVARSGGSPAGLKAIFDRLRIGGAVVLFPEGTRSPDGEIHEARPGLGLVIVRSDAPVIPVRVFGTFEAFGRHMRRPRPGRVVVTFGEPLDFRELRAEVARGCSRVRAKEMYRQAADHVMKAIRAVPIYEDRRTFP